MKTREVMVRGAVPVFLKRMFWAVELVLMAVEAKVRLVGLKAAVVRVVPAVIRGICHAPRPYVAAVRVWAAMESAVTGASGSPAP